MFSNFFKRKSFGLSIEDESIKFVNLNKTKDGLRVISHGEVRIPAGVIELGDIQDIKKLNEILLNIKKDFGIRSVHLSLSPEALVNQKEYLSVFNKSGIGVESLEHKALAVARSVIAQGDRDTYMIIDSNDKSSAVFVITNSDLVYHSPIASPVYLLRDEISKHFVYWHTNKDLGENLPPIKNMIICGNIANLAELSEYLSLNLRNKVDMANVWINILDTKNHIPEINLEKSFGFASALGLALKGFMIDPNP